jgi:hypothetical protein
MKTYQPPRVQKFLVPGNAACHHCPQFRCTGWRADYQPRARRSAVRCAERIGAVLALYKRAMQEAGHVAT